MHNKNITIKKFHTYNQYLNISLKKIKIKTALSDGCMNEHRGCQAGCNDRI